MKINPLSLLAAAAAEQLSSCEPQFKKKIKDFTFTAYVTDNSFWITATWPDAAIVAFRTAYAPDVLMTERIDETDDDVVFHLKSSIGKYVVTVSFPVSDKVMLHYHVTFKATQPLLISYWPYDIQIGADKAAKAQGDLYVNQVGIRSGIIHAGVQSPGTGAFLYMQNLTALNDYCQQTQTSLASSVGGVWPELGFSLPTTKENELPADKEFIISDAYIAFDTKVPENKFDVSKQFLQLLGALYLHLPRPQTEYHDYPGISQKSMVDLIDSKACWAHVGEHSYLNAYACDYSSPPEIMVQLAVLVPFYEYQQWSGQDVAMMKDIYEGLPNFYDDEPKTIMRWLPAAESKLDSSSEQKQPKVMDAWYLHHPLLNLSRMALAGDEQARDLFFKSIDYSIK